MSSIAPKGFVARMAEHFKLPGQHVASFGDELKELTRDDQLWFVAEFNAMGMATDQPLATFPHSVKRAA